jgi:hypothetical protein
MALQPLTEEQLRTMTVEEQDRWWLENVYPGDVPQMTLPSETSFGRSGTLWVTAARRLFARRNGVSRRWPYSSATRTNVKSAGSTSC